MHRPLSAVNYDFSLDREAVAVFLRGNARDRRLVFEACEGLARRPFTQGDYSFVDPEGRENQVIDLGEFVLTFWTDHAARMVRILCGGTGPIGIVTGASFDIPKGNIKTSEYRLPKRTGAVSG